MGTEYRLAVDAFSGEITHVIERDRLVVTYAKSGRTESIPFSSIREINLRQEMAEIFSTFVKREGGSTLRITSRHFRGLGRFDDRRAEYGAFVRSLLGAVAETQASTRFTLGSSLLYWLGWVLVVLGIAFTGLVIVAMASRGALPPLRSLFVLPVIFVVGGGFVRQGRARPFDPMHPPSDLLPA